MRRPPKLMDEPRATCNYNYKSLGTTDTSAVAYTRRPRCQNLFAEGQLGI